MGLLPMDIEILPPYDDRIFKAFLTMPGSEPALKFVASAIINRPVLNVLVRNTELPITDKEEKAERFDLNCMIDDDTQADIEMQSSRMEEAHGGEHSNLKARSIYNLCDLHSSQSSKGKSYDELARSYQVMFCGYTVFPQRKNFVNPFSIRHDTDNGLLHDAVHVIFVELSKLNELLKKPVDQMTDMERFSVFLRYAENPNYREFVNKVIESREGLAVASELLMSISKDERERAIFRSRRIYQADQDSNMRTAEKVGIEKGRAEGRAEGKTEGRAEGRTEGITEGEKSKAFAVAKNMIAEGEPVEKIIKYAGLTRAEVETLKNTN
jgi:predicted transposase/invertase (TIGR01784 family)